MENTAFINELLSKRKSIIDSIGSLKAQLDAIELLLNTSGFDLKNDDRGKDNGVNLFDSQNLIPQEDLVFNAPKIQQEQNVFPINGRKDKQVIWLFENVFKKGIKLQELQDKYNELKGLDSKGKEIRVDNTARRLKKQEKLAVVKYNGSNKNAFWGLPSWIEGNDFDNEHRPNENKLPLDIEFSEVVIGDK